MKTKQRFPVFPWEIGHGWSLTKEVKTRELSHRVSHAFGTGALGKTALNSCLAGNWQHSQDVQQGCNPREAIPAPAARKHAATVQMWLQLPSLCSHVQLLSAKGVEGMRRSLSPAAS